MENTTTIIGLITAIISLIAALLLLINKKKDQEISTINIRGKNNRVMQDNSTHTSTTYVEEYRQVIYVSSTNPSAPNNDGIIMVICLGILLFLLYANRVILLHVMYIPLIISALLSVLICIFNVKGLKLASIHHNKAITVFFALIPVFISVLFIIQNKLFLFNVDSEEFAQKLQIGTTILFDYVGVFFLLFAQLCVLFVSYVKFPKIRKFMMSFSRLWFFAALLPLFPIILWIWQR